MFRRNVQRIGMRRERFYALTLDRQHQSAAILEQTLMTSRVTQSFTQMRHITIKLGEIGHESSPAVMKIPASWH